MRSKQEVEILRSVFNKAWNDPAFKEELIASPVAAIEKVSGQKIGAPEGRELVIVDQTDRNYFHLNIPPKPEMDDAELTEEQLEMVAGGGNDGPIINLDPIIICFPTDPPPYNPFPDGSIEF